ncbi:hypothetical protein EW145_g2640 [Phellinidium pouzarii]|uniref:Glycogen synthase kinase 1 n=1 Tax=Phellinidium pouzarii TaxID=167371 RepID=A0A4S4LAB9_9AGAM|nr:hypothetical protein EW145_g2640 [Phellinidium pouzarii]
MASHGPINGVKISAIDDPRKVVKVIASDGRSGEQKEVTYTNCRVIGNGSFGIVFQASLVGGQKEGEDIAIKKVLQDKRFKNRELQIMRLVSHPNVVDLKAFFYSNGDKKEEVYLNLVLEYVPETVYRASRRYVKLKQPMPMLQIKLYMYQLLRSLAYIHSVGICHRDIKPQNLLLNPSTGVLKLCDFGSAKILVAGEPNVSYICSRYYRAPELIFGATNYTTNIVSNKKSCDVADIWSTGCVMAELMLGQPLFPGESGIDQLVEIIKVLGTPSREQIKTMNPNYMEHKFPQIKPHPFHKVFLTRTAPEAIDLVAKLLEYTPEARLSAVEAMCHPFFDELRVEGMRMPNGKDFPRLFDFTREVVFLFEVEALLCTCNRGDKCPNKEYAMRSTIMVPLTTTMASPSSDALASQTAYTCDTLPTPHHYLRMPNGHAHSRSRSPLPSPPTEDNIMSSFDIVTPEEVRAAEHTADTDTDDDCAVASPQSDAGEHSDVLPQPPARKLCSLDALPVEDREVVSTIWSNFSSSPHLRRELILEGLLTMCCFSQLSMLSDQMHSLIRLNPFAVLPREVSLKVLGYLDAISLCRAAQVNRQWLALADDDVLWKNICEQHIGQKCHKCGWGLPMLERRRKVRAPLSPPPEGTSASSFFKRDLENYPKSDNQRPVKRMRSEHTEIPTSPLGSLSMQSTPGSSRSITPAATSLCSSPQMITRPWKDVYSERLMIERNWRRGRCTVRTLKGHTDGVMCLQFSETLQHPSFPVLITGSYDRTARVWNLETGTEIRCLRGHSRAVRALQFDEAKLITGSMDNTMRVWNWRTGKCIRILEGHTDGVVCLNFDYNVLASGSVDRTVKVWNFRTGECFTLRGHRDWVNSVQLWDSNPSAGEGSFCQTLMFEPSASSGEISNMPTIDPGKMLFSASDDGSIMLWDLTLRTCVRTFTGHVGQVQSMKLLLDDPPCEDEMSFQQGEYLSRDPRSTLPSGLPGFAPASISTPSPPPPDHPGFDAPAFQAPTGFDPYLYRSSPNIVLAPQSFVHGSRSSSRRSPSPTATKRRPKPMLISGSLDNTIRVWDIESGKAITTLFGHIEGVWAVASDKLRLVWVREENRCMATLVGHRGAVTCLSLGDDKIVSGSDDGDVRIWSFAE